MIKQLITKLDDLYAPASRVAVQRFCWTPQD